MNIKAINPKHQAMVNRAMRHLMKYNVANDQRDAASDTDDYVAYAKAHKKCCNHFDKFLDCMAELPKREQEQIEASPAY